MAMSEELRLFCEHADELHAEVMRMPVIERDTLKPMFMLMAAAMGIPENEIAALTFAVFDTNRKESLVEVMGKFMDRMN